MLSLHILFCRVFYFNCHYRRFFSCFYPLGGKYPSWPFVLVSWSCRVFKESLLYISFNYFIMVLIVCVFSPFASLWKMEKYAGFSRRLLQCKVPCLTPWWYIFCSSLPGILSSYCNKLCGPSGCRLFKTLHELYHLQFIN